MLRKLLTVLAVAIALSFFGVGSVYAADNTADEEPIKIGTFLAVSGPASFLGAPELKTLQHWIKLINKRGGVLGRPLKLVHYDSAAKASKARTFVKRLIYSDNVDLIIGGTTTSTTMAVIPIVQRAGIPFISLGGGTPIVKPVKKWVFKTPHTSGLAARKILKDMQSRGYDKIGLIYGSGGFGQAGKEAVLKYADNYGIEVVAIESYGPGDTDMTAQLTNIANTPGVDAILNFGFGQGPAIVTRNYEQLGIDVPLYQTHGVASYQYIKLAGEAANGVRLVTGPLMVAKQLPDSDPNKAVAMAYRQEYKETFNERPSQFGGHAYDALMIAVNAIKRAGTTDPAAVRKAIENTSGYVGVGGTFNMGPNDHLGLDLSSFNMVVIKNGDFKLLHQ